MKYFYHLEPGDAQSSNCYALKRMSSGFKAFGHDWQDRPPGQGRMPSELKDAKFRTECVKDLKHVDIVCRKRLQIQDATYCEGFVRFFETSGKDMKQQPVELRGSDITVHTFRSRQSAPLLKQGRCKTCIGICKFC